MSFSTFHFIVQKVNQVLEKFINLHMNMIVTVETRIWEIQFTSSDEKSWLHSAHKPIGKLWEVKILMKQNYEEGRKMESSIFLIHSKKMPLFLGRINKNFNVMESVNYLHLSNLYQTY